MEDIDNLLEELRNASINNNKKIQNLNNNKDEHETRFSVNSYVSDNNEFIYEDTNYIKSKYENNHRKSINELDNLLNDLETAKKTYNQHNQNNTKTRRSLEKLIDSLDDEIVINNNDNIEPKASQATKELENLMNSLTTFQVDSNFNNNNNNNNNNNTTYFPNNGTTKSSSSTKLPIINNICQGCGTVINGQVITALGALWHPDHFICCYCDDIIGTSIFYEKDGKPYCENDYLELFSPKCANCSEPIVDKMLTALNKTWHPNCFTCSSCSKLLNDESFLEKNNNAFCKDCYTSKLAPKCRRCSKAIIDNFISAMNSYYHPSCFVCTECGIPFNSSSFYEYNNLPYCEIHYHFKRGSLCSSCQKPINGRCITAMNKKFHPEHFICSFCTKQLNKGTFKEQDDKPFCYPCYTKLYPQ